MLEDGQIHSQRIIYESHPKFCVKCRIFGHFGANCLGPESWGRKPSKQPGGFRSFRPRFASQVPHADAQQKGDRPPSRPSSRTPKGKKWQPRQQQNGQLTSRPSSPNRFEPLRDQNEDAVENDRRYLSSPQGRRPFPTLVIRWRSLRASTAPTQLIGL